jgi:hypothetical protein
MELDEETYIPEPPPEIAGGGAMQSTTGFFISLIYVVTSAFSVVAALGSLLATLVTALPLILGFVAITAVMLPYVKYHDQVFEEADLFMRTQVYPVWRDTVRPIADVVRDVYNPIVCWWNAANWWGYGMTRQVIWPTIMDCGVTAIATELGSLLLAVVEEVVIPLVTGQFLTQYSTWTNTKIHGVALANAWINLYSCACMDLAEIIGVFPIINPLIIIPPAWGVLVPFSQDWADPNLWNALENIYNAFLALLQQAFRLIQQILLLITGQTTASDPFIRPDFRDVSSFICEALRFFSRAEEAGWQRFWDTFIPFDFVFMDYFSIIDTLGCIYIKTIDLVLRLLINIDQAVLYPTNPFWGTVIKKDVTEIINRFAEPTQFDPVLIPEPPNAVRFSIVTYRYDQAAEFTPLGDPNPIYNRKRVTEAVCIFITRTLCDPSDQTTSCFSQGAQQLLMGLDFCCLTTTVLNALADIVPGLFEFTLFLARGSDDFFLFIDGQPFTTHVKDKLVFVVRCILSVFTLIPVVGTCIRDLITGVIEYLLCLIDFGIRLTVGLATLPYYIIVLPGIPNFLQNANEALDFFIAANNKLIAETPSSVKNCLTVILNEGFPVPPIPCPTCEPGGFITPPAAKKRRMFEKDGKVNSPVNLLQEIWGELSPDSPVYRITPLLRYRNHTTNPIKLANMIMMNADAWSGKDNRPFLSLKDINNMVDDGKASLMKRWGKVKKCNAKTSKAAKMRRDDPKLYQYHLKRGDFECANMNGEMLPMMPPYGKPVDYGLSSCGAGRVHVGGVGSRQDPMDHILLTDEELVLKEQQERLTLAPLENVTSGCDPIPPCFDLACVFRTLIDLFVILVSIIARFFNGLIQGGADLQGTMQDFPYFTGELCDLGKECFESDITNLILAIFRPIKCLCQALNLIIPVTPVPGSMNFTMGRPDICCAVQRISEWLACIVQVLFNTIESLALGSSTNFAYFRESGFRNDVNIIFDITLEVIECLCVFLEAIFPLNFIPGFAAAVDFDVCCIPQALLTTVVEILRGILQVIITLATITIDDDSVCYWRLDRTADRQCSGKIDDIGIVVQLDVIIDSFLPMHGEDGGACFKNCANDNGSGGIVPCICQLFNTLIPFRRFPGMPVNCDDDPNSRNCQEIDFCCPFSKLGFLISDSLKFINRGIVALWQPWSGGLPEFFLSYIFCSEGQPPRCPFDAANQAPGSAYQNTRPTLCEQVANDQIPQCPGTYPVMDAMGNIHMRCGEFLCGRMHIIIKDLTDPFEGLLARCVCQFFGLLDRLIALLFRLVQVILPFAGWSCCFCGGLTPNGDCRVNGGYECNDADGSCTWIPAGPCVPGFDQGSSGVLNAVAYVGQASLTAIINFIRQFPLACYWKPFDPITQISETWIFSFLGPTANALCIAIGNTQCFAQSMFLLPQSCTFVGQRFLGSTLRWVTEIIFRVIGFIEAFVRSFIEEENTCVGPNCEADPDSKEQAYKGIKQSDLGKMMVILLSIPIDLLIGDSEVACTTICPSFFAVPAPTACGCWDRATNYGNNLMGGAYEWTTIASECDGTNSDGIIEHVGTLFTNTTGCCKVKANALALTQPPRGPLPACQSPDDADLPEDAVYNTTTPSLGFPTPGSCAALGACRPDALPSCANDPFTPIFLSTGYTGAIDGLVMGLLRYLRCILSNIIGCDSMGNMCTPLGLIFYPAMLIFSLSWQILGGVIRFQVAAILFFFSLFSPPEGDGCDCWEHVESTWQNAVGMGGEEVRLTRFYRRVAGLCYPCLALENKCGVSFSISGNPNCRSEKICADYCPVNQWLLEPTIDAPTALSRCLTAYANASKIMNTLTAMEACTGIVQPRTYTNFDNPTQQCSEDVRQGMDFCFPGSSTSPDPAPGSAPACGLSGSFWGDALARQNLFQNDACQAPSCQHGSTGYPACGLSNAVGMWDCSNNMFSSTYPFRPLVTCGALQIIQNFLEVFDAFLAIFTEPLIVPAFNGGGSKRSVSAPLRNIFRKDQRPYGPAVREPRQAFNKRAYRKLSQNQHNSRYAGLIYGLTTDYPNLMEVFSDALYNYDTSDCWDDPVACACRNLDMPDHCTWHLNGTVTHGRKRDGPMTTSDLTMMLKEEKFCGTTVCDHIIGDCAGKDWATNITADEKNQYINCLDKLIQGDRLHQINQIFPKDFVYNPHSISELSHNMYDGVKGYLARQVQDSRSNRARNIRPKRDPSDPKLEEDDDLEPLHRKFPNFADELFQRRKSAQKLLETNYNIRPHNLMYGAIVQADQVHYKYNRGYYGHMVRLATRNIMEGRHFMPTTSMAVAQMRYAVNDLTHIVKHQPYTHMYTQTMEAVRVGSKYVGDVMEEGVLNHARNQFTRYTSWRKSRFHAKEQRFNDQWVDKFQQGPLFKLMNYTWQPHPPEQETRYFAAFRDHMTRTFEFQRTHWQNRSVNFFNVDLHFWSASDILLKRWQKPVWTAKKLAAWESATKIYYQIYNRVWPGHLTRDIQERFLFLSNCILLDRTIELTTKVVDYCLNQAMPNMKRFDTEDNGLFRYVRTTSIYRNNTYYGWKNRPRFEEKRYTPGDPKSWIRPRLILPNKTRDPALDIDYRVYRRSMDPNVHHHSPRSNLTDPYAHGPANFNFFSWLTRIVEDLFDFAIGAETDAWFNAIQEFLVNPATEISDYPNVGLFYWVRFSFVCNFPENLNCSIGEGVETALLWTIVVLVGSIIIGAYVFPIITVPFQIFGYGLAALLIFMAIAFHAPASCLFIFPSWPIPVGIAIPECAVDAIIEFGNKWITDCYSPLLWPPYMIAGDLCPPNERIDFLNCRDVGVSDGIQHVLFLGVRWFGTGFCDIVLQLAGALLRPIIPGAERYFVLTLEDFRNSSPTQIDRQWFCFYATIPAMITPVLFLFLFGLVGIVLVVPLVLLFNSLIEAFTASPVGGVIPGVDDSAWVGPEPESTPKPRKRKKKKSEEPNSLMGKLMNFKNVFGPPKRKEKTE